MTHKVTIILSACFLLFTSVLSAQVVRTLENIPKTHLADKTRYTTNPDRILSAAACDSIDHMLYQLEEKTGIETVVAVVGSIGQEDCFQFAYQLGQKWGVGKAKNDNGLVILLVVDQRCVQFATGYGLEGDLPDAVCKRVQQRYMVPYLKNQDWDSGMVAGVKAVSMILDGSMQADSDEEDEDSWLILTTILLFLVGFVAFIVTLANTNKCPHCGKHELQRTDSRLLYHRNGVRKEEITYICQNCGHVVKREHTSYDDNYRGGGSGPIIFGGTGGRFSGGGGFSGGSFGGGSFGGGGAGSRF